MKLRVHFSDSSLHTATVVSEPNLLERLLGATERTFTVVRIDGTDLWWDDSRACTVRDRRIVAAIDREHRAADRRQVDNVIWARRQRLSSY